MATNEEVMHVQEGDFSENHSNEVKENEEYVEEEASQNRIEPIFYNRRCSLRPRKRSQLKLNSVVLDEFIHSPKRKRKSTCRGELETIFEEPMQGERVLIVDLKEAKRPISFSQFINKTKNSKRKLKRLKPDKYADKRKKKSPSVQDVEGRMLRLGL